MSSENGVRRLTCFSVSLLWTSSKFKTQFNRSLHHPQNLSPLVFLGGGQHDNSISLCEEILNETLQESILWPLIFSFHEWEVFLFLSAVAVNIVSPASHIFGDILVCSIIIKLKVIQETAISFRVQKRKETQI